MCRDAGSALRERYSVVFIYPWWRPCINTPVDQRTSCVCKADGTSYVYSDSKYWMLQWIMNVSFKSLKGWPLTYDDSEFGFKGLYCQ